jgi:DNA polymerase-3 subunit epsilon
MVLRTIFYDTETTGVKAEKDRIIEIAAYDPAENRTFIQLVNPGCPIPPDATAIHNISDAMVADAPRFDSIGQQFIDFCKAEGGHDEVVLIAHNNDNFDLLFLKQEFARHQLQMPEWKFFDTLKWARKYRRDLPKHSLQFLREIYSIEANNAHRALDDVIILHQVFNRMVDDLSIAQAIELLNRAIQEEILQDVQTMPFGKHQGQPLDKIPSSYVRWLAQSGAFDKPENLGLKNSFVKQGLL